MERVAPQDYAAARQVLTEKEHHLAVAAMLAGRVPGRVWADNPAEPTVVVAQTKLHCFVGGGTQAGHAAAVRALLEERLLPEAQATGQPGMMVHASAAAWATGLVEALGELLPDQRSRQYYERRVSGADVFATPPAGFALRAADAALLAEPHLTGLDGLRAEMCSERESVEAFLAESFGVCAVQGNALAGWCLSEYNLGERCEVGIATAPPYQKQGLATVMTHALLAAAAKHGISRVGWHCWTRNKASAATAQRAGFTLAAEEVVRIRWWG